MATLLKSTAPNDTPCEPWSWLSAETIEADLRKARRTLVDARNTAEDAAAGAALLVRRHPLTAIAATAAAGVTLGCLTGFFTGWRTFRRG